jgi:hypothetical protein
VVIPAPPRVLPVPRSGGGFILPPDQEASGMGRVNHRLSIAFRSFLMLSALSSCAADPALLQVRNSLTQNELAYYSDPFDTMREDLWDRAGYLFREEWQQNYQQAALRFESGRLIIRTQTGSFSKGGLASRYALRGDFDIQLDVRMDLMRGISGMDQLFGFAVFDTSRKIGQSNTAVIGLSMKGGSDHGAVFSNCVLNGKRQAGASKNIGNFNGTFRILRNGRHISTSYRLSGAAEWDRLNTFHATDNDMLVGFSLVNFFIQRSTIQATHSIAVEIDGFKIAAAREIIEDDI